MASRLNVSTRLEHKSALQKNLFMAIYDGSGDQASYNSSDFSLSYLRCRNLEQSFIGRLYYQGMEEREDRIAEAYESTFQWIFEDPTSKTRTWTNFKQWLESNEDLYWITGKAGSGKSTLMKFICHSGYKIATMGPFDGPKPELTMSGLARCRRYLADWAGEYKLLIASFYFWNSGVVTQMTHTGLLLTLLHQILSQRPELISLVAPTRWEALCLFDDDPKDWSREELLHMLRIACKELGWNSRLCLFVDGLDEFSGDHNDLIKLIKDLIIENGVKICVASRPWVVFEDAFKHKPSLRLEDLTYNDIRHFVTSKLSLDAGFNQLRLREPTFANSLIENIVSKSSGVFL